MKTQKQYARRHKVNMRTNSTIRLSKWQDKRASSKKHFERTNKAAEFANADIIDKVGHLSIIQIRILNYLVYCSFRFKKAMHMSQQHIAAIVGCHPDWVSECTRYLHELVLIISKNRRYHYGYRTNIYAVNFNFLDEEIISKLFPFLSSLRNYPKQSGQLEKDYDINNSTSLLSSEVAPQKDPQLTQEYQPPDPMSWSIEFLRDLAAKTAPKKDIAVNQRSVYKPVGFRSIGDL